CTAVLTGLLFGSFPAFQTRSAELNPGQSAGAIIGRRPRLVARRALVVAQIALSLSLVSGAMLFTRSLENLRAFDAGYQRRGVVLARFAPDGRYSKERNYQIQDALLERVRGIP